MLLLPCLAFFLLRLVIIEFVVSWLVGARGKERLCAVDMKTIKTRTNFAAVRELFEGKDVPPLSRLPSSILKLYTTQKGPKEEHGDCKIVLANNVYSSLVVCKPAKKSRNYG